MAERLTLDPERERGEVENGYGFDLHLPTPPADLHERPQEIVRSDLDKLTAIASGLLVDACAHAIDRGAERVELVEHAAIADR
jgi:hypothetical protein